jgi:hypothetical protein
VRRKNIYFVRSLKRCMPEAGFQDLGFLRMKRLYRGREALFSISGKYVHDSLVDLRELRVPYFDYRRCRMKAKRQTLWFEIGLDRY